MPLAQRDAAAITAYGVRAPKRPDPDASGFGCRSSQVPSLAIETSPGDLVVFNQNIWHSSFHGLPGRRMFTLSFGELPRNEEDIDFLRAMYSGQLKHITERQYTSVDYVYGNEFLSGFWGSELPPFHEFTEVRTLLNSRLQVRILLCGPPASGKSATA